ncbi:MAG: PAS domain-containing protein [Planctomycetes bacterium]|nr:PAS domain-containing protein [Planctomycetota bacterium]NOG54727.1 PAS domain-containing protein [Planctomycetota bacterium]
MRLPLPKTLLWRIGVLLVGAQLLITIVLGWLALSGFRTFHYGQVTQELQRIEPVLSARYAALSDVSHDMLDEMVKRDGRATGVRITLIQPDGLVIADSQVNPKTMASHRFGRQEIQQALTVGSGSSRRFSVTLGEDMIYYARATPWGESGEMIVRAALPVTSVNEELTSLTRLVLSAGIASMLLTVVVVYLVSRRFSGQVAALATGAAQFAEGDLSYHIAPPAARELSLLALSLNRMGRQLSERMSEVRSQQEEQRTILESMSSGVLALDSTRRILNINRTAELIFGVSSAEARGHLLQEVIRQPRMSELVNQLLAGEVRSGKEILFDTSDGRTIEARGETFSSKDPSRSAGVLLVLDDVTEQRRFEALRSDFASNVSHELRTPITNIKGYVETLQEVGWDDAQQASRFLSIIRTNSDRLAAIVEDVMSLTRLEQPELRESVDLEQMSAAALMASACQQFYSAADDRAITLRTDIAQDIEFAGHLQLLQQALGNLLSNAIRYSPEGSSVTLAATQPDSDHITFSVADQGPGISAHHLARLFERFYRVDKARSRELGGTGLGLAIVKHIAGVHGGEVTVESTVGTGSVFRLTLPIAGA